MKPYQRALTAGVVVAGVVVAGITGAKYLTGNEETGAVTEICDCIDNDGDDQEPTLNAIAYVACLVPGMETNSVCQQIEKPIEPMKQFDYSGSILLRRNKKILK